MLVDQLSVFVENKPGRLHEVTVILKENNIDIRAMSIADTTDFGILRLIVNDPEKAKAAISDAGYAVSLTKVIAIGLNDSPGGLEDALAVLVKASIVVEYMYAFISREQATASVILRVSDNEKAAEEFVKNGVKVLTRDDII